jgi:hypothetical protein
VELPSIPTIRRLRTIGNGGMALPRPPGGRGVPSGWFAGPWMSGRTFGDTGSAGSLPRWGLSSRAGASFASLTRRAAWLRPNLPGGYAGELIGRRPTCPSAPPFGDLDSEQAGVVELPLEAAGPSLPNLAILAK